MKITRSIEDQLHKEGNVGPQVHPLIRKKEKRCIE